MSKALIIAEKPSVAADIARALGGFERHKDYFESDDYVISSAVGHLLEIKAPDDVEVKRGKWSFANLPVIPAHFDLNPIKKGEERLKLLRRLIRRKDVTTLINACDAGREGELIFRLIVQDARARQPISRLWLQSMTPAAIREAFQRLRDDEEMRPLADAARCRSEADWLVGINGTRAMTAFNSRDGGFYLTTVGRVQTPTLAIVVEREEKIRRFVSRPYFEVHGRFGVTAGEYTGRWFDPKFRKGEDPDARAERIWDRAQAEAIAAACTGQSGEVREETRPATQIAPLLFDLTSLQREANSRFGYSAKTTLSLAQALYERHKVLTYPRTDSRALPEDYVESVREIIARLGDSPEVGEFARTILDNGWVKPHRRVFDNSKISDHFAIIPTLQQPGNLSDAERRLYDLVLRRFLAIFYPAAEFRVTTRITEVAGHQFRTDGRVLVNPGWLVLYRKANAEPSSKEDERILVAVEPQERAAVEEIEIRDLATRPPARFTEATLLSAMEGAGKLIEDDELRAAMVEKGLGTPATRAAIIEGLIAEHYLVREGRELIATAKASQLMTLLRGLGVSELTMPELTGGWEEKLARMERGQLERDVFMGEIREMTRNIVARAKNYGADTVPGDYATLETPCPKCGGVVKENYKRFSCTNPGCDFSITKIPGGRQFEIPEVETLLTERTIGPLQGFRSRMGRPFAAILKISPENKLEFDFGQDDASDAAEPVDFSGAESLGSCPRCGGRVFEHGLKYVCERAVGPERSCDFTTGKIILQQEVTPEQVRKLLAEGRTDLLTGFVSSRTGRKFKAYLVRGADGKVGFEFEPRPAKGSGKAAGTARSRSTAKAATADGSADAGSASTRAKKPAAKSTAKSGATKSGTAKAAAADGGADADSTGTRAKKPVARNTAKNGAAKSGTAKGSTRSHTKTAGSTKATSRASAADAGDTAARTDSAGEA